MHYWQLFDTADKYKVFLFTELVEEIIKQSPLKIEHIEALSKSFPKYIIPRNHGECKSYALILKVNYGEENTDIKTTGVSDALKEVGYDTHELVVCLPNESLSAVDDFFLGVSERCAFITIWILANGKGSILKEFLSSLVPKITSLKEFTPVVCLSGLQMWYNLSVVLPDQLLSDKFWLSSRVWVL